MASLEQQKQNLCKTDDCCLDSILSLFFISALQSLYPDCENFSFFFPKSPTEIYHLLQKVNMSISFPERYYPYMIYQLVLIISALFTSVNKWLSGRALHPLRGLGFAQKQKPGGLCRNLGFYSLLKRRDAPHPSPAGMGRASLLGPEATPRRSSPAMSISIGNQNYLFSNSKCQKRNKNEISKNLKKFKFLEISLKKLI
jgi:hypothetical protein